MSQKIITSKNNEFEKKYEEELENISFLNEENDNVETIEKVRVSDSTNDIILDLYRAGLSILEIARELGLGVGEVKLVIDLYQGVKRV